MPRRGYRTGGELYPRSWLCMLGASFVLAEVGGEDNCLLSLVIQDENNMLSVDERKVPVSIQVLPTRVPSETWEQPGLQGPRTRGAPGAGASDRDAAHRRLPTHVWAPGVGGKASVCRQTRGPAGPAAGRSWPHLLAAGPRPGTAPLLSSPVRDRKSVV